MALGALRVGGVLTVGGNMRLFQSVRGTTIGFWTALTLGCALCGPVYAQASSTADAKVQLDCTFETGSGGSFDEGAFVASEPSRLTFSIADIDLDSQSAGLVTDSTKPPGALRIVRALNANHYIEAVTEGFLNLTTVYDAVSSEGAERHPAVHSRHFGVLGQAVYAQYTGFCVKRPLN